MLRKLLSAIVGCLWFAFSLHSEAAGGTGVEWEAHWIGGVKGNPTASTSSEKAPKIVLNKALYGVEGNRAKQIDLAKVF